MLPNKLHIDQTYCSLVLLHFSESICHPGSSNCQFPNPTKADFAPYLLRIHESRECPLSLYYSYIVGYDDPRTAPALSDLLPCTTPILLLQKNWEDKRELRLLLSSLFGLPYHNTRQTRAEECPRDPPSPTELASPTTKGLVS